MIEIMIGKQRIETDQDGRRKSDSGAGVCGHESVLCGFGIELNGMRLSAEEANRSTLADLGAQNNDILMYNKKNDNG